MKAINPRALLPFFSLLALCLLVPMLASAEFVAGVGDKMSAEFRQLVKVMQPLCKDLINTARALGGFGALWYIGYRVYKHLAAAEAIDFFPLLRPFFLSILIGIYPLALDTLNALLEPTVIATDAIVKKSRGDINDMMDKQIEAIFNPDYGELSGGMNQGDIKDWYQYEKKEGEDGQVSEGMQFSLGMIGDSIMWVIKAFFSWALQLVYLAAALCINVLRTFYLVILGIIGPLVLAISIYDGFAHTLVIWIGRYINVFLWLPICNLIAALTNRIYAGVLFMDADQGWTLKHSPTDITYLIFLFVAIYAYFSVPSIANFIVHASGGAALTQKMNSMVHSTFKAAGTAFGGPAGGAAAGSMTADKPGPDQQHGNMADAKNSEPYHKDAYQVSQIAGK
ncbi:conjugative transposon protein TraJ [Chitinophaga lutea]|uniref:Conjugative transposon protein TraJ n=1 Tax=Chitinophaga lutea TaxID=2488634 RepID=A0A3N4PWT6_9BACT|nr:conjugative transposon protein TraJ [Chitinophaga lutea]RPE13182.1 conjugative transposon protein TraJ [Chitinophaga lutea]